MTPIFTFSYTTNPCLLGATSSSSLFAPNSRPVQEHCCKNLGAAFHISVLEPKKTVQSPLSLQFHKRNGRKRQNNVVCAHFEICQMIFQKIQYSVLLLHRQIRISHKALVNLPCDLASLADRPYDQGLASVHIPCNKYILNACRIAVRLSGNVGALI